MRAAARRRDAGRMTHLTRLAAAACTTAALALTACGGDDDASTTASTSAATTTAADPAQLAEQAVTDYVAAFTDRDPAGACALMSEKGQAHVQTLQEVDDCQVAIERILAGVPDDWMERFRSIKISDVEIRGDIAVVKRTDDSDEGVAAPPTVRRVGDEWLVEFERP